ncbi:MAG TPA: DUF4388 domain-containing protein [Acidimicrobiia bacterium]|nr:DUF4388 domain-containing protein [Acidimicrobiia bacterium]
MSLSGNLGFVPIDEVLRLLTRSNQQGAVEVTGNGLRGRVFVGRGGVDLVTTSTDSELHRHLVNSGMAEESVLRRIISGETTLAALAEANQDIIDLLREMSVESLFQVSRRGEEFEVHENLTSPYSSPKTFDLEALLADARDREREWDKVTEIIPDLTGPISFRRDLGQREEVTVRADDWKVLSELGTGASVADIADRLGTTKFWTARIAARLAKSELVELASHLPADDAADAFADEDDYVEGPSPVTEPNLERDERFAETYETSTPAQADTWEDPGDQVDEADHDESWWEEPAEAVEKAASETPTEGSQIPTVDHDDRPVEVEEDTEAFLEKVFSELESSESETEEGHGLLRRRRMGSLRDFSSDS